MEIQKDDSTADQDRTIAPSVNEIPPQEEVTVTQSQTKDNSTANEDAAMDEGVEQATETQSTPTTPKPKTPIRRSLSAGASPQAGSIILNAEAGEDDEAEAANIVTIDDDIGFRLQPGQKPIPSPAPGTPTSAAHRLSSAATGSSPAAAPPSPVPSTSSASSNSTPQRKIAKPRRTRSGGRYKTYTIQQRLEVVERIRSGSITQAAVSKQMDIPLATISTWKKTYAQDKAHQTQGYDTKRKRKRNSKVHQIDSSILLWLRNCIASQMTIALTELLLKTKAQE